MECEHGGDNVGTEKCCYCVLHGDSRSIFPVEEPNRGSFPMASRSFLSNLFHYLCVHQTALSGISRGGFKRGPGLLPTHLRYIGEQVFRLGQLL